LILFALAGASVAHADSFVCETADQSVRVKLQNHVHAAYGTREAAILVVSDLTAAPGTHTLITSTDITQNGPFWTANTPDGDSESKLGELFLAQIQKVTLDIPSYNFNESNKDGETLDGVLYLYDDVNSDSSADRIALNCTYSTKN
jgi:calcineurin-like phosphoesterase